MPLVLLVPSGREGSEAMGAPYAKLCGSAQGLTRTGNLSGGLAWDVLQRLAAFVAGVDLVPVRDRLLPQLPAEKDFASVPHVGEVD